MGEKSSVKRAKQAKTKKAKAKQVGRKGAALVDVSEMAAAVRKAALPSGHAIGRKGVALKTPKAAEAWVQSFAAERKWSADDAALYLLNVAHGRLAALERDRKKSLAKKKAAKEAKRNPTLPGVA